MPKNVWGDVGDASKPIYLDTTGIPHHTKQAGALLAAKAPPQREKADREGNEDIRVWKPGRVYPRSTDRSLNSAEQILRERFRRGSPVITGYQLPRRGDIARSKLSSLREADAYVHP